MPETETTATVEEQLAEQPVTQEEATPPQTTTQSNSNINNLSLEDQVDDFDPEADADAIVLPPEGLHSFRLKLGKKGCYGPTTDKDGNPMKEPKLDKYNRAFFVAEVEAYLIHPNPRYDGIRVFSFGDANQQNYVTSIVMARTKTSAAADMAAKTGYPFRSGAKLGENRQHFETLMAAEPTIKGLLQWQATKETGEEDENGYAVRRIAIKGMRNFDLLRNKEGEVVVEDGQPLHNPRTVDPSDNSELVGRAVIARFLPVTASDS